MDYLTRLEKLEPRLRAHVVPLENSLLALQGWECFSGSMKGISAYGTLRHLITTDGVDMTNKTLIDASSGNFARGLAAIAEYLGLSCELVVSTKATKQTLELIETHGAKVTIGGDSTLECYKLAEKIALQKPEQYVLVGQLDNPGNSFGHQIFTGPLIPEDVTDVYLAMGSGGGIHGVCKALQKRTNPPRIFATVARPHEKIVGTFSENTDYETPFIQEARSNGWISGEISINAADAREGMICLREEFGLFAGFSSGGVYSAYKKNVATHQEDGKTLLLCWDAGDRWTTKL